MFVGNKQNVLFDLTVMLQGKMKNVLKTEISAKEMVQLNFCLCNFVFVNHNY